MKYVCVSAANIEPARQTSASVRACREIAGLLLAAQPDAEVEILALLDYDLRPCCMCGACFGTHRCTRDEAFNQVFEILTGADAIFLVVPHYAPLPSKLMILTEKMQEMTFLSWCADSNYRFPLAGRPLGVVGHGGQSAPEALPYYQKMLVEPVAMALEACQLQVVGAGEDSPRGAVFGIASIRKRPGSIFVDIQHDWDAVRARLAPLVTRVSAAVSAEKCQ